MKKNIEYQTWVKAQFANKGTKTSRKGEIIQKKNVTLPLVLAATPDMQRDREPSGSHTGQRFAR